MLQESSVNHHTIPTAREGRSQHPINEMRNGDRITQKEKEKEKEAAAN